MSKKIHFPPLWISLLSFLPSLQRSLTVYLHQYDTLFLAHSSSSKMTCKNKYGGTSVFDRPSAQQNQFLSKKCTSFWTNSWFSSRQASNHVLHEVRCNLNLLLRFIDQCASLGGTQLIPLILSLHVTVDVAISNIFCYLTSVSLSENSQPVTLSPP